MGYFAPRVAKTTIDCPNCNGKLEIRRSCREVTMYCPQCASTYPLKDFIGRADRQMEDFLENIYMDRI